MMSPVRIVISLQTLVMKFFILFINLLFHYHSVNCDFLSFVIDKYHELTREVNKFYHQIVVSIKNAFTQRVVEKKLQDIQQYILEEKVKQSFNDFVEKEAAVAHAPESFNFRAEPTALMSTPQLASVHGKRVESHVVRTEDDYLLTLHRIYNGTSGQTVILHHGLMGSSADWILLGPEKSLPYLLSDAGYDVWLINARGNYYSRGHMFLKVNASSFWKFSFQEMGQYDLPAIVDYIKDVKPVYEKLNFIGHSMGATALLIMLSTHPHYNKYFRIGILLAPLAFMTNARGPIKMLSNMSNSPPSKFLEIIGDTEFIPSRTVPKIMATEFCNGPKLFCNNPLLFLAGGITKDDLAESFLARLLYHVPAGASTNTILHYGQLTQNGKFHRFREPSSEYPLDRVTIPIALISSTDDWLSTVSDVVRLYLSISNPIIHFMIRDQNLSHTEFVWGINADRLVFPKVMEILMNGSNYRADEENEI